MSALSVRRPIVVTPVLMCRKVMGVGLTDPDMDAVSGFG